MKKQTHEKDKNKKERSEKKGRKEGRKEDTKVTKRRQNDGRNETQISEQQTNSHKQQNYKVKKACTLVLDLGDSRSFSDSDFSLIRGNRKRSGKLKSSNKGKGSRRGSVLSRAFTACGHLH